MEEKRWQRNVFIQLRKFRIYHDYNLVMATSFGMPQGDNVIRNKLKRLIREHDLPDVVFHSIRHTSVSTESTGKDDAMRCDAKGSAITPGMRAEVYRKIIRENINYDELLTAHSDDRELIEGIVDLMLETVVGTGEELLIASSRYPAEIVRSKFLKLNFCHIEYVLQCLKQNTTRVKNIRKWRL